MDGSFTLENTTSFRVQERFCDSTSYSAEIIRTSMRACDFTMLINWGRRLEVLFEPFCKSSCRFLNSLPHTFYASTFLVDGVIMFEGQQEIPDGVASIEMYLHPMFTANVLNSY